MEIIFNQFVLKELQVPLFSEEFNNVIKVDSFSDDTDKIYAVNLHQMTCSCMDFVGKNRGLYLVGDIRRMCKHLKNLVERKIELDLLHPLCKYILQKAPAPGKYFHKLNIDQFKYIVFVAFDNKTSGGNYTYSIRIMKFFIILITTQKKGSHMTKNLKVM